MTKNIKFFFVGFLFSLPLFWGTNVFQKELEDFLFWGEIANNPQVFTAQISQDLEFEKLKPIRNWQVKNLEIEAKSAISVLLKSDDSQKILFKKEDGRILSIASLTKLMTANIVLEYYDLDKVIPIREEAASQPGLGTGKLKAGESFQTKDLLYPTLIESNNISAFALAQVIGQENFVSLMNLEAKNLDLKNTYFFNPTGLDPDNPGGPINYSTAQDLAKLAIYLLKTKLEILEISVMPEFNLYPVPMDGVFPRKIKNTNELLKDFPEIIGSKTGWTPEAQGCLLLVIKAPQNRGVIISVILGSFDRFGEMKKLVEWLQEAYKW